ncbi:hypothetical protein RF11_15689 [Thelohanellus kitauei]|uniref:ISXO2-like transposase domain-containing protein n=1 Tax=Thelohanellus kitauei TaxID=669202 RepID=A0A0C2JKI4_THEKT|nr:hypothetical protein RF11_15689 [Thelohanellus kitauei]
MAFSPSLLISCTLVPLILSPTIEIDESQFYWVKYNVGRLLSTDWFFEEIDRLDNRKYFLAHVSDRKAKTLLFIIQSKILPGTTIVSDSWRAYNTISTMSNDYDHLVVNHTLNFVNPRVQLGVQKILKTY